MAVFNPQDAKVLFDDQDWQDLFYSDPSVNAQDRINALSNTVETEIATAMMAAGLGWPPSDTQTLEALKGFYLRLFRIQALVIIRGVAHEALQNELRDLREQLWAFARQQADKGKLSSTGTDKWIIRTHSLERAGFDAESLRTEFVDDL